MENSPFRKIDGLFQLVYNDFRMYYFAVYLLLPTILYSYSIDTP